MKKNILAIQIPSAIADLQSNFDNLEFYLDKILQNTDIKPDFLFLPEVWSIGWFPPCFMNFSNDEETLRFLTFVAKKYSVNIFGGSFIRNDKGTLKNSMPVISRKGDLIGYYDKIHLYTPDGEGVLASGTNPCLFEIEGLKIGVSICYDIRFPELYRSYMSVEIPPHLLINLSAWPKTRSNQYYLMASSRAVENQSYFLALSQCGEIKDGIYNSGCSCLINPMGECLSILDENIGYIFYQIDTSIVDNVRNIYPNLKNKKINDFGFKVKEFLYDEVKCLKK